MDKNKFHLAVLVALGPNSLRLKVWTQYPHYISTILPLCNVFLT